ncbi:carbamoyltransferase C-terminal domain-containing protein [Prochlorococcus marinus]|uniref:carbamoyltransferase C-terminal domain-containing protein n=1 Tax=Prochlorococcus marinus TaxID=1219 RepID=UPI0022B3A5E6|nr:carbamoyltransferase C-terminal domain-containing protein [Prochlorococcus marinus]
MNILGVYDGHNANAALVSNGNIIAAVEEERFSRVKNHTGIPINSIKYCLEVSGNNIDAVAFAFEDPNLLHKRATNSYFKSIQNGFIERLNCDNIYGKKITPYDVLMYPLHYQSNRKNTIIDKLSSLGIDSNIPLYYVPHHLAHASSAYYKSPYDDCLIVTLDGKGDDLCGLIGTGLHGKIKQQETTNYIYSICIIYTLVTSICGFKPVRHEGKITGLAALGKPDKSLIEAFKKITYTKNGKWYGTLDYLNKLGPYPHVMRNENFELIRKTIEGVSSTWDTKDLAATVQKYFEDEITSYIDFHMKEKNKKSLVLAGGAFANVKLNQAIYELNSVKEIHIHPAMTDSGLGLGAALMMANNTEKRESYSINPLSNAFLGPDYSELKITETLSKYNVNYNQPININQEIATQLYNGKIVARFNGRLEYGPRALGNRSILFQTTDITANDWLNKKLKRTEFMPFAPVTLEEFFYECYEDNSKEINTYQFMTITVNCSEKMKNQSPAVVHVDGTARPQIVNKSNNPGLFSILTYYYKLSGIPSLINTSFNPHEEPIVCSPDDALKAFIDCKLDFLQIGPFLVEAEHNK